MGINFSDDFNADLIGLKHVDLGELDGPLWEKNFEFFFEFSESPCFNWRNSEIKIENFSKIFLPGHLPRHAQKTHFGLFLENQIFFDMRFSQPVR